MIPRKRQLIFLWMYREWGGAQIYFLAIMKLAAAEWDITVILPRDSLDDIVRYVNEAGATVEFLNTSLDVAQADRFKRKIDRHVSRFKVEREALQRLRKFDLKESILHVETAPWQSWQFLTILLLRGANVFVTLHNALPRYARWREMIWMLRMKFLSRFRGFHIFASNQDTKNRFRPFVTKRFWQNIPVTYTCVNPNEIDEARRAEIDISAERRRLGLEDSFLVLCVGQFIDRKGRWMFLEAARDVVAADDNVSFVWLTSTPPTDADQTRVKSYGLGEKFRLVLSSEIGGTRADVLKCYRLADVFALPSFVEGLPISLLEAMAMGVPSISTNINAIPEALRNEQNGILIEAGDSRTLADAILRLKADAELRDRLGRQAREDVIRDFDEREASRIAIPAYEACFADG